MNRRVFMACLGLVLACGAGARADGWSIGIGYGAGFPSHGHGHWHGHYHYDWWPRPYYYPPVYVAPPPVVYVPTAPAVPVAVPAVSATPAPTASTAATPKSNALPSTYQGAGVVLRNPAATGTNVSFVIDGRIDVDLAPGQSKPLNDKASYVIEFDRGGDFGTARRVINEGTYEFTVTATGWDLQREQPTKTDALTPVVRRNALPAPTQR